MDKLTLYDAIYGLVAADGREPVLFGKCSALAREAFSRSIAGDEFPIIWFELPLTGPPRFDLHVALSHTALSAKPTFAPGAGNGYDELFSWYGNEEAGGGGLAFAYDVSEGQIDEPAVHVNVNRAPLGNMACFFELASSEETARLYESFASELPEGWRVWYAGVHPGRPGSPVRVDCFVDAKLQSVYAHDLGRFEEDLHSCGFTAIGNALPRLAGLVLNSPFGLELQFDVLRDGSVGPTLGISAGLPSGIAEIRESFETNGAASTLLEELEQVELADSRWEHIPDTMFAKLVPTEEGSLALYCKPTFVKLRMREGQTLDAKAYLQAGAVLR